MPEILRLFGLRFYIYLRDHLPPHIHVRSQDGEAKFSVTKEGVELIANKGMKPKDVSLAKSVLEENKELVLENWVKYHG